MIKKTIKSYETLIKKINASDIISEQAINRIKNALSRDYSTMSDILEKNGFEYCYNVSQEQADKGARYLVKKHLTLNGKQRKTSNVESDFLEMIKAIQNGASYSFTFDGFKEITNGFFHYYAPIYTLYINGLNYSYFHYNGVDYAENVSHINDFIYAY